MTRKNRHLAEWRFLLFSRWTRIEDRMTQNMNRKHEKHVCHPLSGL